MPHVLIVDDEASICWGLQQLAQRLGWTSSACSRAEEALAWQGAIPDVILLDVRLPGMTGLDALPRLRTVFRHVPTVVMTAYGELSVAVEALRLGAIEYLIKPFDLATAEKALLRAFATRATHAGDSTNPAATLVAGEQPLIGRSAPMQEVFKQVAQVAPTGACVHIVGESGTGKELIARAIHRYSRRASEPFLAVNLAALSPSLIESELFGHVRGAFTGAEAPRKGLLEQASGGTIFLDEVAEVPLTVQVKLLRAVEHGEIWPVGSEEPRKVGCRVLSATHRELTDLMATGEFRHDLYYRLVPFVIRLPALRDRGGDLALFVDQFVSQLSQQHGVPVPVVPAETLGALQQRHWPGNVRELRNAVERAVIVARGQPLTPEDFLTEPVRANDQPSEQGGTNLETVVRQWCQARLSETPANTELHPRLMESVEATLLTEVLRHTAGSVSAAARLLGIHRTTLRRRLDELNLARLAQGGANEPDPD